MKTAVFSRLIAVITVSLIATTSSYAQSTWSGGATPFSGFSAAGNWDVAPTSGGANNLFFAGSVNLSPSNDITLTTLDTGITFNPGASTFTIIGGAIRAGNITNNSSVVQNIIQSLRLNGTRTINVGSAGMFLGQPVGSTSTSSRTVTKTGSGDLTITGGNAASGGSSYNVLQGALVFSNSVGQVTSLGAGAAPFPSVSLAASGTSLRLNNAGTVTIAGGVTTVSGSSVILGLSSGTLILSNTLNIASGATLSGIGTIKSGNVLVSGDVEPGTLGIIGGLTNKNTLTFTPGSSITMELDRSLAINADLLAGGTLNFDGLLNITNIGTSLQLGDIFNLFDGTLSGTFASTNLPTLGAGLGWDFSLFSSQGIISVEAVPEPTTVALFSTAAVAVIWRARRRRS